MVLSPLLVAAVLTFVAFLLAGMTEGDGGSVASLTLDSAIAIGVLVGGFTLTFGILLVLCLWSLRQRGVLVWLLAGLLAGAMAGVLFGAFTLSHVDGSLILIFAFVCGALMLLIRGIAGIRDIDTVE